MNSKVAHIDNAFSEISAKQAEAALSAVVDWTKYDGKRVTGSRIGTIYLALRGKLCAIPNPDTFNNLFNNWDGVESSDYLVDNMPEGEALTSGAVLARGDGGDGKVYLITNQSKQHVPSPQMAEQFNLDLGKVKGVAQVLIDSITTGADVR